MGAKVKCPRGYGDVEFTEPISAASSGAYSIRPARCPVSGSENCDKCEMVDWGGYGKKVSKPE